jgi:sugar diacid utilization regulator
VAPLRDGVHGDHVLGVVYVADRQLREFNTSEVQVTASLACDIGAALTKVRQERENQLCLSHLAQQLSKAERSLEVIGRITEMLANNSDLRAAMEIAVAHLGSEYFPIELSLLDEVGHELINVYSKNEVEDSTDLAEAVTEKLYSLVAGRRRLGLLRVKLGAELDELHAAVVKQLASLFVLELLHQRSSLDVELQLHSSVLDDLLKGNINEKDAVARAALIGLNLHSPHFVAAVGGYVGSHTGIPPVLTKPVVEAVASAAQRHYPHPLITVHDGVAYIVLESSDRLYQESTVTLETLVRTASSLAGGMGLSAGVGRLCLSPTDFAESARDALLALEVARTQPHENKVVNTEDLGSYAVLAHSISSKVLESLHDKVLAPLIQADKRGHDYLTTLNTYLARNLHLKETAAVLHVHVNTLRYRLRKIEELIGMDLRSSEDRFLLELALHVDKVRRSTISLDR